MDLVTFTEEILYGKHHFFCAVFNLDREEREMLYRKIYKFQKFAKTKIKSSKRFFYRKILDDLSILSYVFITKKYFQVSIIYVW